MMEAKKQKEKLKRVKKENTSEEHQVGNFRTATTLAKPSPTASVVSCPALRILAPAVIVIVNV